MLPPELSTVASVGLVVTSFFTAALTAALGLGGGVLLLAVMAVPGLLDPQDISDDVLFRDYPVMTAATLLLAAAIYSSARRRAATDGCAYLGRTVGVLLTGLYGVYYYWLFHTV